VQPVAESPYPNLGCRPDATLPPRLSSRCRPRPTRIIATCAHRPASASRCSNAAGPAAPAPTDVPVAVATARPHCHSPAFATPLLPSWLSSGQINVLLLGADRRRGTPVPHRHPHAGDDHSEENSVNILSFPRELVRHHPRLWHGRIKHALDTALPAPAPDVKHIFRHPN